MKDGVGASDCCSSFVITINDKLDALSSSPPNHTIFKIHELLRRENVMAYEPEILAIGPYHRGKEHLQAMEVWKLRCLKSTLEQQGEVDATKYVEAMKRLEGRARECYSESIICQNADEFAEMLLLDGCFIIQFLILITGFHHSTAMINHRFLKMIWAENSICRDMLLLENQIPLFVLEQLFYLTKLSKFTQFHVIAQAFAGTAFEMFSGIPKPPVNTSLSNVNDVEHLLGLLHHMFRPPPPPEAHDNDTRKLRTKSGMIKLVEWLRSVSCGMLDDDDEVVNERNSESIPSATKLHDAGVTFKIKKVENNYPFEITFSNGVMEVPIFDISDGTEAAFRNLIAYEQYCQNNSPDRCFARHADFMDSLIDSPEDVALLRRCGIIGNYIGDDEAVSTMFNKLCKHITFSEVSNHRQIFEKVNAHCGRRRHRWMAKLRRDYFNNPWSFISFLAALFLLLLTVTQTVFSALGT